MANYVNMSWHIDKKDGSLVVGESSEKEEVISEEKTEDSPKDSETAPEYKDYKTMDEIPEKEKKHYGI